MSLLWMVVVDSMAAITDTVADVTGFIDVSESIVIKWGWGGRLGNFTKKWKWAAKLWS